MKKETKIKQLLKKGGKSLKKQELNIALNNFLQAYDLDTENPEIQYFLGITYARMEKYKKSVHHLEEILSSELAYINRVHTRMILGYIYTIEEEHEKALSLFKGIVKSGFNNAQAYAAIGYIMDRLGNFKEAVMNLYRAIEMDPKNANAHNSLGYIFAETNINLEEALEECKLAVSMDRNNPAYLDSVGWVYYKLGKINQAKNYLNRAQKKAPKNEEIRNHLRIVNEER